MASPLNTPAKILVNWFGSPVTITRPAEATTGRLLITTVYGAPQSTAVGFNAPPGWTEIPEATYDPSFDFATKTFYRIVQAGDSSSDQWTVTAGSFGYVVQFVFEAGHTVLAAAAVSDSNIASAFPQTVNGNAGGTALILSISGAQGKSPYTPPATFTEVVDFSDATYGGSFFGAVKDIVASGPVVVGAATASSAAMSRNIVITLDFGGGPLFNGSAFRYWTGSAWGTGVLKRWDGSAWVAAQVRRWNGSAWVNVP